MCPGSAECDMCCHLIAARAVLRDDGSPVLGKAVPLTDTPTVFPTHTHPDTPLSNVEPEGTCLLTQRGKMQVVSENQEFSLFQGL